MGNPHLLRRIGRALGRTEETKPEPSQTRTDLGTVVSKSPGKEERLLKVQIGKEEIEYRNLLAWIDYRVGQRVEVRRTDVYAVAYDYAGEDFSKKVEVRRALVRTEVSINPTSRIQYSHW